MLLVPLARSLDTVLEATLASMHRHPGAAALLNATVARLQHRYRRRRNLAALASMRELDDSRLRDLGIDRIALARARIAPAHCDPIAVLRREAGLK